MIKKRWLMWLGRNPILIHFGQIWSNLIKNFWPFVSSWWMWQLYMATFFDWGELQFDQVWSILDSFDPIWAKKNDHFYPHDKCNNFLFKHFLVGEKSNWIKFDQVWSILDRSDQIWSKKFIFVIIKGILDW